MQPSRARGLDLSHYGLMEDGAALSPPLGPCHLFHFAVHLAERLQATPSKIFSELISARLIRLDSDCVSNGRIDFRLASKLNKKKRGCVCVCALSLRFLSFFFFSLFHSIFFHHLFLPAIPYPSFFFLSLWCISFPPFSQILTEACLQRRRDGGGGTDLTDEETPSGRWDQVNLPHGGETHFMVERRLQEIKLCHHKTLTSPRDDLENI